MHGLLWACSQEEIETFFWEQLADMLRAKMNAVQQARSYGHTRHRRAGQGRAGQNQFPMLTRCVEQSAAFMQRALASNRSGRLARMASRWAR
jgi:hypothetical protein